MARKTQVLLVDDIDGTDATDRKSTRLNSSHVASSYAVFCLKKKNKKDGTGKKFDIKDYTVGGKTGTAQMPDPDGKGYLTGKNNYVFSFSDMDTQDDSDLNMY